MYFKTNMTLSVWENKPLRHLWEFSVPNQQPIQYPAAAYFCYFWGKGGGEEEGGEGNKRKKD